MFQTLWTVIDGINLRIGRAVCWLALIMVLAQFALVAMRYVFGVGSVVMQEMIVYMHATLFMAAAGYTLRHDDHVRCDIFYRDMTPAKRAWIDLLGVLFFLLPMCIVIIWVSAPYVANAWAVLEGSSEGSLGLPGVFLLKTLIPLMALLLGLQGLSVASRAAAHLRNRTPPGVEP
ncbi:MAG: TRAP transporter small permease subunit [Geminicoccaceae bacterium]